MYELASAREALEMSNTSFLNAPPSPDESKLDPSENVATKKANMKHLTDLNKNESANLTHVTHCILCAPERSKPTTVNDL